MHDKDPFPLGAKLIYERTPQELNNPWYAEQGCEADRLKAHPHVSEENRGDHPDYGIRKALGEVGSECPDVGNVERRAFSIAIFFAHEL